MECRICGADIPEDAKFCPSCGNRTDADQDEMEIIEEALLEAQEVFHAELESSEEFEHDTVGEETTGRRKSARDRIRDLRDAVKEKTDNAVEFGHKVGDTTQRAVQKTREVQADVSQRVGSAVDKTKEIHADVTNKVGATVDRTKEISGDVAETAKKVGKGVRKAVDKTRETIDELGQVGVIITQRALDVVRASLRAVEIVDNYLEKKRSPYEVGNFITGVGIPPYLEIEFTKRSDNITSEEKIIVRMLRESDYSGKTMEEVSEILSKEKVEKKDRKE